MKPILLFAIAVTFVGLTQAQERMAGATNTTIDKYPFLAAISYANSGLVGCGAILTDRWILTAASVIIAEPANFYLVRVGTSNFRKGATRYRVISKISSFNYNGYDSNLGMVKLVQPLRFGRTIQPIPIATCWPDTVQVTMVSFGQNEGNLKGGPLQRADLELTIKPDCYKKLTNKQAQEAVKSGYSYCVRSADRRPKGHYLTDAGAPAVVHNRLYGIFSYTENKGGIAKASVATRVPDFQTFIQGTIDMDP
ncbi:chymotrypsin-1-like [Anopheles cruzii]|uniref:chymotrypsin-1-like n=1 Tax=Anopheles cruzii TaxID=68878 RepID=UPI0022EC82D7|nr:chymotrypsin-1-like [Anopheles cruzii]